MEELTKQEKERRKELKQEVSLLQKLWLSWTELIIYILNYPRGKTENCCKL